MAATSRRHRTRELTRWSTVGVEHVRLRVRHGVAAKRALSPCGTATAPTWSPNGAREFQTLVGASRDEARSLLRAMGDA